MIPVRQRLIPAPRFASVLPTVTEHENGTVSLDYKDESKYVLPDVESTRLRDLLEAGVDLKQVNTKLFTPSEVVTHVASEKQDTELKGE